MPRSIIYAALACALLHAHPARAQVRSDSLDVVVKAWDAFIGSAPFQHPRGTTARVCVRGYLNFVKNDSIRAPAAFVAQVDSVVKKRPGVTVLGECVSMRAPTQRTWVVDASNEAAVVIEVDQPLFTAPDKAEIKIAQLRGGRWGRDVKCFLERAAQSEEWKVRVCRTLFRDAE